MNITYKILKKLHVKEILLNVYDIKFKFEYFDFNYKYYTYIVRKFNINFSKKVSH
jgi:hypothetical protein